MSFFQYINEFSMFSKDEVLSVLTEIQSTYVKNEKIKSIVEVFSVGDEMECSFIDYINYLFIDEYILEEYKDAVNPRYERYLNSDYQEIKKRVGGFENKKLASYHIKLAQDKEITCSLLPFIFSRNKYALDQETINHLSHEDKLVIAHLFLSNQIKSNLDNTPYSSEESNLRNQQYFNNLVSIVIENEQALQKIYQKDDKPFISHFFKSSLILQIARYTDKNILQQLIHDDNQLLVCKKILQIKNKEIDSMYFFPKMMTIVNPKVWVKLSMVKKYFSFFKYVGYQLEEATGIAFPEEYSGKKRKHPNRAGNMRIAEVLADQIQYILKEAKEIPIERKELLDWYLIIMSGKLIEVFKLMVKHYPLKEEEKKDLSIIQSMKQLAQNDLRWSDIYFKEELENNLDNINSTKPKNKI